MTENNGEPRSTHDDRQPPDYWGTMTWLRNQQQPPSFEENPELRHAYRVHEQVEAQKPENIWRTQYPIPEMPWINPDTERHQQHAYALNILEQKYGPLYSGWTLDPDEMFDPSAEFDYSDSYLAYIPQLKLGYTPTYWEDPYRVARYYQALNSMPSDTPTPEWIDRDKITAAYNYFRQANGNKPWTEWKFLNVNDPARQFLASIGMPPEEMLLPQERIYKAPPEQDVDAMAGQISLEAIMQNPNIPWWNKALSWLFLPGSPEGLNWKAPLATATVVGLAALGGGIVGGLATGGPGAIPAAILAAGKTAAWVYGMGMIPQLAGATRQWAEKGEVPAVGEAAGAIEKISYGIFGLLNMFWEGTKRITGIGVQAGLSMYDPERYGPVDELFGSPEALKGAWHAGFIMPFAATNLDEQKGRVWQLGQEKQTYRPNLQLREGGPTLKYDANFGDMLRWYRNEIAAGVPPAYLQQVMYMWGGISPQMADLVGAVVLDPYNYGIPQKYANKMLGRVAQWQGNIPLSKAAEMGAEMKTGPIGTLRLYQHELRTGTPIEIISAGSTLQQYLGGVRRTGDVQTTPERGVAVSAIEDLVPGRLFISTTEEGARPPTTSAAEAAKYKYQLPDGTVITVYGSPDGTGVGTPQDHGGWWIYKDPNEHGMVRLVSPDGKSQIWAKGADLPGPQIRESTLEVVKPAEDFVNEWLEGPKQRTDIRKNNPDIAARLEEIYPKGFQPGTRWAPGEGKIFTRRNGLLAHLFSLTPKSRAVKTLGIAADVMKSAYTDIPLFKDFVSRLRTMGETPIALAEELSLRFIGTPDGEYFILALKDFDFEKLNNHEMIWDSTAVPRALLDQVAQLRGVKMHEVLDQIGSVEGAATFFESLVRDIQADPENPAAAMLAEAIQGGQLTEQTIRDFFKMFIEENVPYTDEQAKAMVFMDWMDHVARWAVERLGVKVEPLAWRLANFQKAVHSLLLLDVNPQYAINNGVNNFGTITVDGAFSLKNIGRALRWWEEWGIYPYKLRQAFGGPADLGDMQTLMEHAAATEMGFLGVTAKAESDATKAIADEAAGKGGLRTTYDTLMSARRKIGVASRASAKLEEWASVQAMTAGTQKFWSRIWRPDKGFRRMPKRIEELLGPELTNIVYGLATDSLNIKTVRDGLIEGNKLRRTAGSYVDEIARGLNMNPEDVSEILHTSGAYEFLNEHLPKASSPAEVQGIFSLMRQRVQRHLDTLQVAENVTRIEQAAAQVEAGDWMGLLDNWFDLNRKFDDWWMSNSMKWTDTMEQAAGIKDHAQRNALVAARMTDANMESGRMKGIWRATIDGIQEGLRRLGIDFPEDYTGMLDQQFGLEGDFFLLRDGEWRAFWRKTQSGELQFRSKAWKEEYVRISNDLDRAYGQLALETMHIQADMDQGVVDMVARSNPELADALALVLEDIRDHRMVMMGREANIRRVRTVIRIKGKATKSQVAKLLKEHFGDTDPEFLQRIKPWLETLNSGEKYDSYELNNALYDQYVKHLKMPGIAELTNLRTKGIEQAVRPAAEAGMVQPELKIEPKTVEADRTRIQEELDRGVPKQEAFRTAAEEGREYKVYTPGEIDDIINRTEGTLGETGEKLFAEGKKKLNDILSERISPDDLTKLDQTPGEYIHSFLDDQQRAALAKALGFELDEAGKVSDMDRQGVVDFLDQAYRIKQGYTQEPRLIEEPDLNALRELASEADIATLSEGGTPINAHLINFINARLGLKGSPNKISRLESMTPETYGRAVEAVRAEAEWVKGLREEADAKRMTLDALKFLEKPDKVSQPAARKIAQEHGMTERLARTLDKAEIHAWLTAMREGRPYEGVIANWMTVERATDLLRTLIDPNHPEATDQIGAVLTVWEQIAKSSGYRNLEDWLLNTLAHGDAAAQEALFQSRGISPWSDIAAEYYGLTGDPREAFFLLHDGTFLDGSGRNEGSMVVGQRVRDHSEIGAETYRYFDEDTWQILFKDEDGTVEIIDEFTEHEDAAVAFYEPYLREGDVPFADQEGYELKFYKEGSEAFRQELMGLEGFGLDYPDFCAHTKAIRWSLIQAQRGPIDGRFDEVSIQIYRRPTRAQMDAIEDVVLRHGIETIAIDIAEYDPGKAAREPGYRSFNHVEDYLLQGQPEQIMEQLRGIVEAHKATVLYQTPDAVLQDPEFAAWLNVDELHPSLTSNGKPILFFRNPNDPVGYLRYQVEIDGAYYSPSSDEGYKLVQDRINEFYLRYVNLSEKEVLDLSHLKWNEVSVSLNRQLVVEEGYKGVALADGILLLDETRQRPAASGAEGIHDESFVEQRYPVEPFYHQSIRVVDTKMQDTMPVGDFLNWIKKQGIKKEEFEWTGLLDWAEQQEGQITKNQVLAYLNDNQVRLHVIRRPDVAGMKAVTKWERWTLPGGENYREHLVTMPRIEGNWKIIEAALVEHGVPLEKIADLSVYYWAGNFHLSYLHDYIGTDATKAVELRLGQDFKSGHWSEPNILVHMRTKDRLSPDGDRVYFIEEIQSDWHQQGRERGYLAKPDAEVFAKADEAYNAWIKSMDEAGELGVDFQWTDDAKNCVIIHDGQMVAPVIVTKNPTAETLDIYLADEGVYEPVHPRTGEQRTDEYDVRAKYEYLLRDREGLVIMYGARPEDLAAWVDRYNAQIERPQFREARWIVTPEQMEAIYLSDRKVGEYRNALYAAEMAKRGGIPDAPFKKNWHELALKEMIRQAAEEGHKYIAWTTGHQQSVRYYGELDGIAWRLMDYEFSPMAHTSGHFNSEHLRGTYGRDVRGLLYDYDPDLSYTLDSKYGDMMRQDFPDEVQAYLSAMGTDRARHWYDEIADIIKAQYEDDPIAILEELGVLQEVEGTPYWEVVVMRDGDEVYSKVIDYNEMVQTIGEGPSRHIEDASVHATEGQVPRDLLVDYGEQGMTTFYDQMLPSWAKKFGKQFDAEYKKGEVGTSFERTWTLPDGSQVKISEAKSSYRGTIWAAMEVDPDTGKLTNKVLATGTSLPALAKELGLEFYPTGDFVPVHMLEIPESMRESVLYEGQKLFQMPFEDSLVQRKTAAIQELLKAGYDQGAINTLVEQRNFRDFGDRQATALELIEVNDHIRYLQDTGKPYTFGDYVTWLRRQYGEGLEVDIRPVAAAMPALGEEGYAPAWELFDVRSDIILHRFKDEKIADIAKRIINDGKMVQTGEIAPKGSIAWLDDGRAVIEALTNPDITTALHETGHLLLKQLPMEDKQIAMRWYQEEYKGEVDVTKDGWYFTGKDAEDFQEKFSQAFERFLVEEKAPTPTLAGVFKKIAAWILEIYRSLKGTKLDVKINDELRDLFSRYLSGDPELAQQYGHYFETRPPDVPADVPDAPRTVSIRGQEHTQAPTLERWLWERKAAVEQADKVPDPAERVKAINDALDQSSESAWVKDWVDQANDHYAHDMIARAEAEIRAAGYEVEWAAETYGVDPYDILARIKQHKGTGGHEELQLYMDMIAWAKKQQGLMESVPEVTAPPTEHEYRLQRDAADIPLIEAWIAAHQRRGGPGFPGSGTSAHGPDMKESYDFVYRVVELEDLIPSHTLNGDRNKNYPSELQWRKRERAASVQQINTIAAELNPKGMIYHSQRLDDGTPIIGPDLLVESGNGRTLALVRAARDYPENFQAYKDYLIEQLRLDDGYGYEPSAINQIAEMEHPVLVRERKSDVDDRVAFVKLCNDDPKQSMSEVELAASEAVLIPLEALASLEIGENQSIQEALRSPRNRGFVRGFVESLPPSQVNKVVDANGELSAEGMRRIVAALFARTFPGPVGDRLLRIGYESLDVNVKRVIQGIEKALGELGTAEALIQEGRRPPELSIGEDLAAATSRLSSLRKEGMGIEDYFNQSAMFQDLTDFQKVILSDLWTAKSAKQLSEKLKRYGQRVQSLPDVDQMGMFGEVEYPDKAMVWEQAREDMQRKLFQLPNQAELGPIDGVPEPMHMASLQQEAWDNVQPVLNELERRMSAGDGWAKTYKINELNTRLGDSAPEFEAWLQDLAGDMASSKYAAMKWGENVRDYALLDYNANYGADNYATLGMPYFFWPSRTFMRWALRTIDKPSLMANYFRFNRIRSLYHIPGFPSRLKGKVRVNLPWAPDWMGSTWVDPLRAWFPPDMFLKNFAYTFDEKDRLDRETAYLIQQWVQDGRVDETAGMEAINNQAGEIWKKAQDVTRSDSSSGFTGPMDYLGSLANFSMPVEWTRQAIAGTPENIGPLPLTRMAKTLTGVNLEQPFRRAANLPDYDKFEDYRVQRMMSNQLAEGNFDVGDVAQAYLTHSGPTWDQAQSMVNQARFWGTYANPLYWIGFPMDSFPEGEARQRALGEEWDVAREYYKAGDSDAFQKLLEKYPEYQSRLDLWKDPEQLLRYNLVDEIWSRYMELEGPNKELVRLQLGEDFQTMFLDKPPAGEKRNYETIPIPTLARWAQMIGYQLPELAKRKHGYEMPHTTEELVTEDAVNLLPPELATEVQEYRDWRNDTFPNWYAIQQRYFQIPAGTGARSDYLENTRDGNMLLDYWQKDKQYKKDHPFVGFYTDKVTITDKAGNELASWRIPEILSNPPLMRQLTAYQMMGDPLSAGALYELRRLWERMEQPGADFEHFVNSINVTP